MSQRAYRKQLRLNEMKSNFVSSVSHELRAPIASVLLMAEGLESERVQGEGKQRQYFHFIVQECRRLSSLIENVLDFSRIEQNRKQYEFEETDVARLVEDTVAVMQPAAEDRRVKLVANLAQAGSGECVATIDSQAIRQALINLIDNAIKHSPHERAVTISLSQRLLGSDTTSEIFLSVEDEGPGIPEVDREQIFERFYRRGSELRRETQGVGIGLSIVKHIINAHNGTVVVIARDGEDEVNGSRFEMRIPVSLSRGRGIKGEGETQT
jgi:signal transduction histidine kinase